MSIRCRHYVARRKSLILMTKTLNSQMIFLSK